MVALSSMAQVCRALCGARRIDLQTYTVLGPVLKAVEAAAHRGAEVTVRLEGRPFKSPDLAKENRNVAGQLRAAGATLTLAHPLHAKVLAVDGTLYLDDRNWRSGDLVVKVDDPAEVAKIPMIKHEALACEGRLIDGATTPIACSSKANRSAAATKFTANFAKPPSTAPLQGCSYRRATCPEMRANARLSKCWFEMALRHASATTRRNSRSPELPRG
jgi:hypothetical protein